MKRTTVVAKKWRAGALALVAAGALAVGVSAALAANEPAESEAQLMELSSCNSQLLGDGSTIYWTSAHRLVPYAVNDPLEIVVKWWRSGGAGSASAVALRGSGFSPSTVTGQFLRLQDGFLYDNGTTGVIYPGGTPAADADDCNTTGDAELPSNTATFYFEFNTLHKPGKKPNAKGNAQVNVTVNAGGQRVTLGTNIHVLTEEDEA